MSPQSPLAELQGTWLTVTEVAGHMRVSKMTVYRLIQTGELAAVRVGRSFRVLSTVLFEYLKGNATN